MNPYDRAEDREHRRANGLPLLKGFQDDDILTDSDIDEFVNESARYVGDRKSGASKPQILLPHEVVVTRSEYVVLIRELDRRRKRIKELEEATLKAAEMAHNYDPPAPGCIAAHDIHEDFLDRLVNVLGHPEIRS